MLADVSQNCSIGITGFGSYVPDRVMTNDDLAELVATSDEWITERTGIKERHIAAPDQAASDLKTQYPGVWESAAFRAGYARGQQYLEQRSMAPQ